MPLEEPLHLQCNCILVKQTWYTVNICILIKTKLPCTPSVCSNVPEGNYEKSQLLAYIVKIFNKIKINYLQVCDAWFFSFKLYSVFSKHSLLAEKKNGGNSEEPASWSNTNNFLLFWRDPGTGREANDNMEMIEKDIVEYLRFPCVYKSEVRRKMKRGILSSCWSRLIKKWS